MMVKVAEREIINLGIEQDVKEIKISAKWTKEERERFVSLNVWTYSHGLIRIC